MEQPRSIMALFHKFRLVLNFDQRCSRHEPSVPKREVTASHPRLPPRPATTRGCSGSLFKSSPIFFDRENTELDPVLRHLFRRSFRAAVYISRVSSKVSSKDNKAEIPMSTNVFFEKDNFILSFEEWALFARNIGDISVFECCDFQGSHQPQVNALCMPSKLNYKYCTQSTFSMLPNFLA